MPLKSTVLLMKARCHRPLWLAAAAAISLAGCGTDYATSTSVTSADYRVRHPIVLTQAPTTLDVFPGGQGSLDAGTTASVKAFAERYISRRATRLTILAPSGARASGHEAVDEIRRVLAASGVRGYVAIGSYPVGNSALASPIRLSFQAVKAVVPSRCGQWPSDLASGGTNAGWENEPYHNFGCATQSMIAAQVDDPRDFAVAEALGPSDVQMRLRAIGSVRDGKFPDVIWKVSTSTIGAVAGSN